MLFTHIFNRVGEYVTYACDKGFLIDGEPTANCVGNGEWSSQAPTCVRACSYPGSPEGNGSFLDVWQSKSESAQIFGPRKNQNPSLSPFMSGYFLIYWMTQPSVHLIIFKLHLFRFKNVAVINPQKILLESAIQKSAKKKSKNPRIIPLFYGGFS